MKVITWRRSLLPVLHINWSAWKLALTLKLDLDIRIYGATLPRVKPPRSTSHRGQLDKHPNWTDSGAGKIRLSVLFFATLHAPPVVLIDKIVTSIRVHIFEPNRRRARALETLHTVLLSTISTGVLLVSPGYSVEHVGKMKIFRTLIFEIFSMVARYSLQHTDSG